jgi:glutathione synthase/RimK-type ligase-like ATP-grasp enzyme
MFYIYSQMNIHGTRKRDKDYLLLMDTLEQMNIEFEHLPEDISEYNFTKNDLIFLNFGAINIDFLLDHKNFKNTNVYPSIETCKIYNKDKFNIFCEENNLSIPKTFYNLDNLTDKDFPLLFKPVSGSLSEYLTICYSRKDVIRQLNLLREDSFYRNKNFILQEFIDTGTPVTKFRTIFAGDIKITYKAVSQENSNFVTLGDNGVVGEINPDNKAIDEISNKFITVAKTKNINFGALDIIQDVNGACYLLELNAPTKLYRASQGLGINLYQTVLDNMLTK